METIGLAVTLELPLVIIDVQRAGLSTGMPTKPEQADLLLSMWGRNAESPVPVIAASTPGGCFDAAIEAARIALKYRTPVFLLSDAYLANGSEPWLIPDLESYPEIRWTSPTRPTTRAASCRTCATRRPWHGRGRSPARPASSTGSAGSRRRTGPATSRTTPTTTTTWSGSARKGRGHRRDIPELTVDEEGGEELLVLSWGGTYGPVAAGVRRCAATAARSRTPT